MKSFSFRKKQKEIKIFSLLQNWRLFHENLQFYFTKNQNRRKTEQKEIKGPKNGTFIIGYVWSWMFVKVVIILKAMAALNLSTKNSNRGREIYLAMMAKNSLHQKTWALFIYPATLGVNFLQGVENFQQGEVLFV